MSANADHNIITTLQEEWRKYRDAIYPDGISGVQNRETHQAFFAGAFIMGKAMMLASVMPEAQAVAFLDSLVNESETFMASIKSAMEARN